MQMYFKASERKIKSVRLRCQSQVQYLILLNTLVWSYFSPHFTQITVSYNFIISAYLEGHWSKTKGYSEVILPLQVGIVFVHWGKVHL